MGARSEALFTISDPRINVGLLWLTLIPGIPYLVYLLRDVSFILGVAVFSLLPILYLVVKNAFWSYQIEGLDKRAVFITGCDSGFGRQLALRCAKQGMPVFAGCMTEKGATSLKIDATGFAGTIETIILDVTSTESVAAAAKQIEKATEKYGGLHALVNNAGVLGATYLDDFLSIEQYKEVVENLVKKTRGRIVTISSAAARVGNMYMGPYTTSKYAVNGYCEVVRQELRFFGVSLHILEPGIFKTPMCEEGNIDARFNELWRRAPEAAKVDYGEDYFKSSQGRFRKDVEFCASDRVDFVIDAYFHAITARFPQMRYQLGNDCHYMYFPMSYMPSGLRDTLFTLKELLTGVPVPECAKRGWK